MLNLNNKNCPCCQKLSLKTPTTTKAIWYSSLEEHNSRAFNLPQTVNLIWCSICFNTTFNTLKIKSACQKIKLWWLIKALSMKFNKINFWKIHNKMLFKHNLSYWMARQTRIALIRTRSTTLEVCAQRAIAAETRMWRPQSANIPTEYSTLGVSVKNATRHSTSKRAHNQSERS